MMEHVKKFEQDKKLTLNVGGCRHEIMASTIEFGPDTRLYWIIQKEGQSPFYDPLTNEFFFDRNPLLFPYILNYYRAGKLHCPPNVCGAQFAEELQYWAIDETFIDTCCWENYRKHKDAAMQMKYFDSSNQSDGSFSDAGHRKPQDLNALEGQNATAKFKWAKKHFKRFKSLLWVLMEDPVSSKFAQIYTFISILFIAISVTTFCLESMKHFQQPLASHVLFIIESVCVTWFSCEIVLRFVCCPDKPTFLKNWLNWIDLCAIAPFVISLGLNDNVETITTLRIIRVIRIFRVLKLSRHFPGLQILGHTLKASIRELLMLIFFLSISVVIFSSLIYNAEKDEPATKFTSIPAAFWWSVVTMTTVGYGDYVPMTIAGKCIGTLCALCGVLVVSLPIPIVVSNFSIYYSQYQSSLRSGYKMEKENHAVRFVRNLHPLFGNNLFGLGGSRSSLLSAASRGSFCMSPLPLSTPSQLSPSYSVRNFNTYNRLCLPQQSIPSSPLHSTTQIVCRPRSPIPICLSPKRFSFEEPCKYQTNETDAQNILPNVQCDDVFDRAKDLTIKVHPPSCSDNGDAAENEHSFSYTSEEITVFNYPDPKRENSSSMLQTPRTESVYLTPISSRSFFDQSGISPTTSDYGTGHTTAFATTPDSQVTPTMQFPRMGRRNAVFSDGILASRWRKKCLEKRQKTDKQMDNSKLTETLLEVSSRLKSYLNEEMKKTETYFQLSPLNSSSLHVRRQGKKKYSISSASGSSFEDDSTCVVDAKTKKNRFHKASEKPPKEQQRRLKLISSKPTLSVLNNAIKPVGRMPISPKYVLEPQPSVFQFEANEDSFN